MIFEQKGDDHVNPGSQETEFNEYMLVGLGFGLASIVAIGMMIYCRKYKSVIVDINWVVKDDTQTAPNYNPTLTKL